MRNNDEEQLLIPTSSLWPHGSAASAKREPPSLRGILVTLFVAIGIFGASTGAARYFFSRGSRGRQSGSSTLQSGSLVEQGDDDGCCTISTLVCAGDLSLPVMKGADLVSYFSLEYGQAAMYGMWEHQSSYGGYTFLFVSEENKALFEEEPLRYIPAWGGFCGWGIAQEHWWTASTLGPAADPNSWLIMDGVLYFFRSELPKSKFMGDTLGNIETGDKFWRKWWGAGATPAGGGHGSPLDTACFCNADACANN